MSEGKNAATLTFHERLELLKAERAAREPKPAPEEVFDKDLVPDEQFERSEENTDLDRFIQSLDIVDVYNRWSSKTRVVAGNKRESIKVSCPNPAHPDKRPSAWLNRDKNVWYCSGCDEGGDVYEIAAWHFGFPVPGYKDGSMFHKLREEMALASGYSLVKVPGLKQPILAKDVRIEPISEPDPVPSAPTKKQKQVAPVEQSDERSIGGHDEDDESDAEVIDIFGLSEDEIIFPTLDWKELVPEETFLREYLNICSKDDVAEEYHFWNGLLAIGFVLGRDVLLNDDIPVPSNLFICLLGHTGDGKSKSFRHLSNLLTKALPYRRDEDEPKGVQIIKGAASAEALIHRFSKPVFDPVNPKAIAFYAPIRGLIEYNELSALVGRTARVGSVMKPTLIDFYDCLDSVSTDSVTSGLKHAEDPFASMFTTTQPTAMKDLVTTGDAGAGFLNRWVFVSGKEKTRSSLGGIQIDITPSIPLLHDIRSWTGRGKEINVDDDAAERWDEFFQKVVTPAKRQDQSSMLARIDLLLKKLFLLFCANEHQDSVNLDIVNRVIKMYPYIVQAYGITAAQIGNTVKSEITDEVLRHAERFTLKNKSGVTARDLNKCMARKKYDQEVVNKIIRALVEAGRLEEITTAKGKIGRPTVRYAYVG